MDKAPVSPANPQPGMAAGTDLTRRTGNGRRGLAEHTRSFFNNRFVYAIISQRASGLSIGVNMNPDRFCTFDCVYCEVDHGAAVLDRKVDVEVMAGELKRMLALAQENKIRELPGYQSVPAELLKLKEVALSGEGEPSLCPNFEEVVQRVAHLRAQRIFPFFKLVLITNGTGLHLANVQKGLQLFTVQDEVWVKLDAGTQEMLQRINRPRASVAGQERTCLDLVMENILNLGRQRPVVIQSLFPQLGDAEPEPDELEQYVQRLRELKTEGANISLVQVYSAHRPTLAPNCAHLPLKSLSRIAARVKEATGLRAEVF